MTYLRPIETHMDPSFTEIRLPPPQVFSSSEDGMNDSEEWDQSSAKSCIKISENTSTNSWEMNLINNWLHPSPSAMEYVDVSSDDQTIEVRNKAFKRKSGRRCPSLPPTSPTDENSDNFVHSDGELDELMSFIGSLEDAVVGMNEEECLFETDSQHSSSPYFDIHNLLLFDDDSGFPESPTPLGKRDKSTFTVGTATCMMCNKSQEQCGEICGTSSKKRNASPQKKIVKNEKITPSLRSLRLRNKFRTKQLKNVKAIRSKVQFQRSVHHPSHL